MKLHKPVVAAAPFAVMLVALPSAPHFTMTVASQNQTFILDGSNLPPGRGIIVIAGEAKIRIAYGGTVGPYTAFLTLQITPESFPPDKTLIIPLRARID